MEQEKKKNQIDKEELKKSIEIKKKILKDNKIVLKNDSKKESGKDPRN